MTTIIISAEAIGNNIDLLTEILVRLPTKPLIKFKCVSKQWLSLISDPQFCDSHTRHHLTPTALLLQSRTATLKFEILPLKHDPVLTVSSFDYFNFHDFRIRQSCNGLLLCSSKSYVLGKHGLEPTYYICNPTTKQFKGHSPLSCEFRESLVSVCMAFDPLKSNHYKLICVRTVQNKESYQIHMYSSHTDSWSDHLEITFTLPSGIDFANPVFCNGAIHWYSKEETSLYFDADTECFNTMPMPKLAHREVWFFGESRGHLHLIVTESPFPLQFDVLEMASDYSGWFVRYHVNLDDVRIQFPENRNRFSVLNVVRAQKEEESIIVILVDNKAISYNVHDRTSKKLCDLELQPAWLSPYYRWSDTFQYFESLTSV